jgi:hypothetical protein
MEYILCIILSREISPYGCFVHREGIEDVVERMDLGGEDPEARAPRRALSKVWRKRGRIRRVGQPRT